MLLVDAEYDGLGEAVGALEEVGKVSGNRLGARTQRDDALEVLGLVFVVRHRAAKAVQFVLGRTPASGIHGGYDAMHAIRREKAILDALAQAVGVDRVAEVIVAVAGFLAQRRGRHAELHGGREVIEYRAPVAVVAAGAAMAFVDDDQIEEVRPVLAEHVFVGGGQRLIDAEVHVPALAHVAPGDLVAGIAKRREHLGHRVIDQDVAVGQEQDLRAAVFACAVDPRHPWRGPCGRTACVQICSRRICPAAVPQLPAELKRHAGLASAGGQGGEHALLAEQDGLDHAVDRDLLVVARHLAGDQVEGFEQVGRGGIRQRRCRRQPLPEFGRCGEAIHLALGADGVVDLDDTVAVGGIGELEAENLGVLSGLLHPGFRRQPQFLGLHDGQWIVAPVVQQVVRTFLPATAHATAGDDDAAIGEGALLADHVRRAAPSGLHQLWRDQLPTGVGLGHDLGRCRHRGHLSCSWVIPSAAWRRGAFGAAVWRKPGR